MPGVLAISATAPIGWALAPTMTSYDNLASYSNYGQSVIAFAAPGGDSAYPGNENCTLAGLVRPCWVFDLVCAAGGYSISGGQVFASYSWSAGTSMGLIKDIPTCKELVERIVSEAEAIIKARLVGMAA